MRIVYHHRTRATDAQRIHILEMVAAFRDLGHRVEIVSLVDTEAEMDNAQRDAADGFIRSSLRPIPFAYDAVQLAYNLAGFPLLLWKTLRFKAEFIYERYSLFNFAGALVSRLCGIPLVLEVNSPFALEQQRDRDIRAFRLATWTERAICNSAKIVIVVSTPLCRIMIDAGVDPAKIVIMPNGVNLAHFQAQVDSRSLRRSLGLENRTVIGFIGWFRKWHGLRLLLQAFRDQGLAGDAAAVLLIGDGPEMADLNAYVTEAGLTKDVIFTGPIPHPDVPPFVGLIDIAVQPAANEYCCPMKIFEYMAAAKPIVAPRQENIVEVLRDGEDASLFTPEDEASLGRALRALIRDAEAARRMGERAREAINRRGYLWLANARRVVETIEGLPVTGAREPVASGQPRL